MSFFGSLFGWFKTDWIKEHLQLHDAEVKRAQLVITRLDNHWNEINRLEDKLDSDVLALKKQIQCISQNCEFPVGKQQKLNNKLKKLRHRCAHLEEHLAALEHTVVPMFQSGKSQLASDTLGDEEATADGITFEGEKGIEYVTRLIEQRGEAKKLLQAQQRMINRLYKLAVTTVEDPRKSITEELRKAEKWKKTLRKKLKAFEEK